MIQLMKALDTVLDQTARTVAGTIPDHFCSDLNVIYFPQLGNLVGARLNPHAETPPGWELQVMHSLTFLTSVSLG
jgi:hypothetical protein